MRFIFIITYKSLVGGSPTVIFVGILLMAYEYVLPAFWGKQVDYSRDLLCFPYY
jgi:hypothetical protein